jgi:hypothetical protein
LKLSRIEKPALAALLLALGCARLPACGPDFPNSLLVGGDNAILVAPVAAFSTELARLKTPAAFHAVTNKVGYTRQSADLELEDLAAALKQSGRPDSLSQAILASQRIEREKLRSYLYAVEAWNNDRPWEYDPDAHRMVSSEPAKPMPPFPDIFTAGGMPDEFTDYFDGAVAWAKPDGAGMAAARAAWERLLALPANERRFKSTWAAFMLGKSWAKDDPEKAAAYFRQVRDLARRGFLDSAGLAAASLGEEARIVLNDGKFAEALELYLDQFATGDPSAVNSIRFTAAKAINSEDEVIWRVDGKTAPEDAKSANTNNDDSLQSLAANQRVQPVITAYLISRYGLESPGSMQTNLTQSWLAAVESANVRDVDSAEKLALAAYQIGDWDSAQRWIDRARTSPVAQWLQARLLLRAGKTDAAAALLAKVAALFPPEPPSTNVPERLFDNLTVEGSTYLQPRVHASAQVSGELGVFRLARRDYTESLDVLLRAGFWEDAAYVAERVLTADELKDYVARNWPAPKVVNTNYNADPADSRADAPAGGRSISSVEWDEDDWDRPKDLCPEIRGLLARRLARLNRPAEARGFFTPELQADFDSLQQSLSRGADTALSAGERAEAWFAAAKMTRTNGMDLLGTELAPDWHIHGGNYDSGLEVGDRTNDLTQQLPASEDELRRASEPAANPDTRYHYRYIAAAMAWQAALLMPDNSDATARVLCEAGSWIKYLDPDKADVFYKALVRRCRKTAIGDQADKMRWFPVLDAAGNPIPYTPPPPQMDEPVIDTPIEAPAAENPL